MPRYYFHTCDGTQDIDRIGHELPDDNAARREAVRYGGGLLCDDPGIIGCDDELRITVTKEDGSLSCAVIILAIDANRVRDDRKVTVDPRG
ncbi:MAG: DUF6894 family protein [Sphingopyxis sp.]